jgi:GWxTD domain-containing protein
MTAFALHASQPLVHAVGWALLHFCWQGALVALSLACVLAFVPQRAARTRYAAACVAMALMAVLPLATFGVLAVRAQADARHSAVQINDQYRGAVLDAGFGRLAEPWAERFEDELNHSMPQVVGIWIAGVFLLLCRLNLGLLGARKLRFDTVEPAGAELQQMLESVKMRLGVARAVELLQSARVEVPTVVGWLKPLILVPAGCVAGLSSAQVEAILAHELAHIRRHDYLVNLLQSVTETALFYHPAVWWVSKRVRQERENCCDDLAVSVTGDRLGYARTLSLLEEMRATVPAGAFAANGGVLKMRIARLLGLSPAQSFPRAAAVTMLMITGAVMSLAAINGAHAQLATVQPDVAAPQAEGNEAHLDAAHRTWIDEDVRWIISRQEAMDFLALGNNEERDHFIEQFWERRNPNPGSQENGFRSEHYRRLAYANQHFAWQQGAGWMSDRGHVYVVFGPPDSIDSHPSAGAGAEKGQEIWHYNAIQIEARTEMNGDDAGLARVAPATISDVDFRFVDDCNCGAYRLSSPWPMVVVADNPEAGSKPVFISALAKPKPDLACTYYFTSGQAVDGTCETHEGEEGKYFCANNGDKSLSQEQSGCEWKLKQAGLAKIAYQDN